MKKTLLPELLPAPQAAPGPGATPPQRVAERARLLLQRFRGLGTTAGAAVLSLHCGAYGVVDPLPPPARQCAELPDPFPTITTSGYLGTASDAGVRLVVLELQSRLTGLRIDAVRVQNGTLLRFTDVNPSGSNFGNRFQVTIAPDASPSTLLVDVDLGCAGATRTKHYRIMNGSSSNKEDASVSSDFVFVEELPTT